MALELLWLLMEVEEEPFLEETVQLFPILSLKAKEDASNLLNSKVTTE
jgi:hypothetical protein